MEPITTTLNTLRAHGPCADSWAKALRLLGKTAPDDEPIALGDIARHMGLVDALWCLRAVEGQDREMRLFAVACARRVQNLMTDPRSLAALDVAERFANGAATEDELGAARDAAWDAAAAAWAAAGAAAGAAVWDAEREWQAQKFIEIFGGNDETDHHHS